MKIFDPHVHMTSRTTDDYEAMAAAGIVAVVEPAVLARAAANICRQLRRLFQ
jgi:predicted metal-dependent TIM-barrel fold hydrolase